ncbi:MAG: hypothetical protein C0468_07020 [Planctomyces sp.]|nr:hypothetical protein [Planctomyces sp.]
METVMQRQQRTGRGRWCAGLGAVACGGRAWAAVRLGAAVCVGAAMAAGAGCAGAGDRRGGASLVPDPLASAPVTRSATRERAIAVLSEMARSPRPEARANALEALLEAPARLREVLPAGLRDPSPAVRAVAVAAVGRVGAEEFASRASALLRDPSPYVRASAVYAAARLRLPADQTPLAAMLAGPDLNLAGHAAYVLGEIGNQSAAPVLRSAARRASPLADRTLLTKLDLQISEALVKLGDSQGLDRLRAALLPYVPADLEGAALAAQILGQLRDRGSLDFLVRLTDVPDPDSGPMPAEVRMAAALALRRMGLPRSGPAVADEFIASARPTLRVQALFEYAEAAEPRMATVAARLMEQDPEESVRLAAAAAILRMFNRGGAALTGDGLE